MGDNLHLVTEDTTVHTFQTTRDVDGTDDGGKVLLANLVRAEVPVKLGFGRVGVVGAVGGIDVTLGWVGATLPGDPDIVADIEKTGGQRADRSGPGVHPVLAGAELTVPQEHRAEIVRQHLAIVVTDDARYSKNVAIFGGDLVALPQPVKALFEHQQGEGIELLAVGLRGLHGLLDTIHSGAFIAVGGQQLCALTNRVFCDTVGHCIGGLLGAGSGTLGLGQLEDSSGNDSCKERSHGTLRELSTRILYYKSLCTSVRLI